MSVNDNGMPPFRPRFSKSSSVQGGLDINDVFVFQQRGTDKKHCLDLGPGSAAPVSSMVI
jgi:hypothetical protein